jgi:transcriptional regulator of aromatic amino acid metabolism
MEKKSKSIREYTWKGRVRKIRNTLVQTSSELEALKINFNNYQEKTYVLKNPSWIRKPD